jgi:hypothetical protein
LLVISVSFVAEASQPRWTPTPISPSSSSSPQRARPSLVDRPPRPLGEVDASVEQPGRVAVGRGEHAALHAEAHGTRLLLQRQPHLRQPQPQIARRAELRHADRGDADRLDAERRRHLLSEHQLGVAPVQHRAGGTDAEQREVAAARARLLPTEEVDLDVAGERAA